MAKTYTVARTVVYYFEVDAESDEQALVEASNLFEGAAFQQAQITQEIIYVEESVYG